MLVRRMLTGDQEAMETFADGYFPGLYRFARARLRGDDELARDIVQTTVCKALSKLGSYRGEAPLFTWAEMRDPRVAQATRLREGMAIPRGVWLETAGEATDVPPGRTALRLASGVSLRVDSSTRVLLGPDGVIELERGAVYVDPEARAVASESTFLGIAGSPIRLQDYPSPELAVAALLPASNLAARRVDGTLVVTRAP